jgi:hypothetical protein
MTTPNRPPLPSGDRDAGAPRLIDAESGRPVPVADVRAEFERLSRQVPRDPEAERAFLLSKIDMVRNDPNLSEEQKERVIEDLRRGLA